MKLTMNMLAVLTLALVIGANSVFACAACRKAAEEAEKPVKVEKATVTKKEATVKKVEKTETKKAETKKTVKKSTKEAKSTVKADEKKAKGCDGCGCGCCEEKKEVKKEDAAPAKKVVKTKKATT